MIYKMQIKRMCEVNADNIEDARVKAFSELISSYNNGSCLVDLFSIEES